jgi:hypothetical protein
MVNVWQHDEREALPVTSDEKGTKSKTLGFFAPRTRIGFGKDPSSDDPSRSDAFEKVFQAFITQEQLLRSQSACGGTSQPGLTACLRYIFCVPYESP